MKTCVRKLPELVYNKKVADKQFVCRNDCLSTAAFNQMESMNEQRIEWNELKVWCIVFAGQQTTASVEAYQFLFCIFVHFLFHFAGEQLCERMHKTHRHCDLPVNWPIACAFCCVSLESQFMFTAFSTFSTEQVNEKRQLSPG